MDRTPQQLGPYELIRPLGAGGMAETFLAVKRGPAGFEQRVCLKRILPSRAADPVFVELFLDEARLLARLQCRNIVHVHDFGEVDGCYYMALELIDGIDLDALLASLRARGLRMPQEVALYIVSEILVALSYAHGLVIDGEPQHIVHRDISPSNILLSKQGEVKLTDFGIAKARGRTHRTEAGQTKGKVAYMSPEQVRAEDLDGRSDLFAVGVVLFELLTGTHPFDATTDYALQVKLMNGERRALRELVPDAPAALAGLVDALLAPDRTQRPVDADAALAMIPPLTSLHASQRALQQLMGNGPQSVAGRAPAPSSTPRSAAEVGARPTTGLQGERPKSRLVPLVAVVLALLACGGLAYALARPSQPAAQEALRSDQPPPLPKPAAAAEASDPPASEPAAGAVEQPAPATTAIPAVEAATGRSGRDPAPQAQQEPTEPKTPASERPHRAERAAGARTHQRDEGHAVADERLRAHEAPRPQSPASEAPSPGATAAGGAPSAGTATPSAPPAAGRALPPVPASTPNGRVIIAAPRDEDEERRKSGGGSYVSPNGRVIMRAPPPR